jgi:hypothetical protein
VQSVPFVIADADDAASLSQLAAATDVIIATAGNTNLMLTECVDKKVNVTRLEPASIETQQ